MIIANRLFVKYNLSIIKERIDYMKNELLPKDLSSYISSESSDFIVKANRIKPLSQSLSTVFFGIFWTTFSSIFALIFLVPLLQGKEVSFESNGVPVVASPDNLEPILVPAIIIGLFLLIGIGILSWGIRSIFMKGGYFVGTPTRLIWFRSGDIRSIDWEQFSGDIRARGNSKKGSIDLQMRTGAMIRSKDGPDRYVPEVIYMTEIPNVFDVEKMCRRRIKENDPTPTIMPR
jgi:hypothetical protein